MANTKITIAEHYDRIVAILEGKATVTEDDKKFILDRKEKHTAKSSSISKAQAENAKTNEELVDKFTKFMKVGTEYTVSDFMKEFDLSNQKVTYLLTKMKNADLISRTEKKGKAYFALIEE